MNIEEGYIKFNCQWDKKKIYLPGKILDDINRYRSNLVSNNLMGILPGGIGFGNISIREQNNQFLITGSATGGITKLSGDHLSRVTNYSIEQHSITCQGLIKASSESLSHAAVYDTLTEINAVVHIHHAPMWEYYIDRLPTTDREASFGTREIAQSIIQLLKFQKFKKKIIIMGGHEQGIIAFGITLAEAYREIINLYNQFYG